MKGKTTKIFIAICAVVIFAFAIFFTLANNASFTRWLKSTKSNFGGGLTRTVTVYDYNGQEIKSWTGKFDVSESENEVYFDDEDGKRIIIHGGIVINEEIDAAERGN